MTTYTLTFTLLSDTTFGSGDGRPGLVNREVEHDAYGLPYLRGRTLKGLLSEEADMLVALLSTSNPAQAAQWQAARNRLFGQPGATQAEAAIVHYGQAELPPSIRQRVRVAVGKKLLKPHDVLQSITAIRRQTAVNTVTELPDDGSLRSMRIIQRQTPFTASLVAHETLSATDEALLAVSVLAWQRAGTGRNRGRGLLRADLYKGSESVSMLHRGYQIFEEAWG